MSQNFVILKRRVFFIVLQMILVSFFDISNQKLVISSKKLILPTLDYGISMPTGINVPGGTFGKINKRASWKITL